ncbi:MAG: hypothetical protein HY084_13980 [Gemmatimonadetes bacterium]|nr:hypothetical protein [Gemmatimonadota bacterium]
MVVQVMRSTVGMAFFAALASAPVGAQQYSRRAENGDIPQSAYPPAGLCRVWLKDVAASQQPAATDCNSAIRNHPANAKVLFGDMPGIPAATRNAPPASAFDARRNSWSEVRRQGGARVRMAAPAAAGAPGTAAPSAATVTTTPASARVITTTVVPVTPPQPAKPAAKPE